MKKREKELGERKGTEGIKDNLLSTSRSTLTTVTHGVVKRGVKRGRDGVGGL